jgi:quercetin dioxygenase-like cupin family protein
VTPALARLLDALAASWEAAACVEESAQPHLATALERLRAARETRAVVPAARAAAAHVPAAAALACPATEQLGAAAAAAAAEGLGWTGPAPVAGDDPARTAFVAGYAYAWLAGPAGPLVTPALAVFLTIQAPHVTYPPHAHPAVELYQVVGGRAEWQRDGEPWRVRTPGEVLLHVTMQGHAMRSGTEPLLSVAVWLDRLDQPSRMVADWSEY